MAKHPKFNLTKDIKNKTVSTICTDCNLEMEYNGTRKDESGNAYVSFMCPNCTNYIHYLVEDFENDESKDMVNHPPHYTNGGIECIDALKAATAGLEGIEAVCTANAIKYMWRWKYKNGIEDIDKAIWYLNRLKSELKDP